MKLRKLFVVTLALTLSTFAAAQQVRGTWRATSKNAQSITGDLAISVEKMEIGFVIFPVSQIRALQPAETKAAFDLDAFKAHFRSRQGASLSRAGAAQFSFRLAP